MSRQSTQEIKMAGKSETPKYPNSDNERIEALAYQLWLERGSPVGSPEIDWDRAEAELRNSTKEAQRAA